MTAATTTSHEALQRLAAQENLGAPLGDFQPARRYLALSGWLLLGLFPCIFLAGETPLASLVPGVVEWPVAIYGLLHNPLAVRKLTRRRIHLYEQGFVYEDVAGELEVFRWDRITLFQRVRNQRAMVRHPMRYRLVVVRDDRRQLVITNAWAEIGRLAKEVARRTLLTQLPVARAALREGRSVSFGGLTVDASGVTGRRRSAPWSAVDIVMPRLAKVTVLAADEFLPLYSERRGRIPNIQLLFQLYRDHRRKDG